MSVPVRHKFYEPASEHLRYLPAPEKRECTPFAVGVRAADFIRNKKNCRLDAQRFQYGKCVCVYVLISVVKSHAHRVRKFTCMHAFRNFRRTYRIKTGIMDVSHLLFKFLGRNRKESTRIRDRVVHENGKCGKPRGKQR